MPPVNPLQEAGNSLDKLIQQRTTDDIWVAMKGELPCVDTSLTCVSQLQNLAVTNSRILKEIDSRIEAINTKIEEAKANGKKNVRLGLLKPVAQELIKNKNPVGEIFGMILNPIMGINKVLSLIGIPLLENSTGGTNEAQQRAIAIADLQVKVAEMQRSRAEIANKIREQVQTQVINFDTSARQFQISQEVAKRDIQRQKIIQISYQFGEGSSESYLANLSSLDRQKAQTLQSWTSMRSTLERIKLLVLKNTGDEEDSEE